MIDLNRRSYQKELMDADDIPFPAMEQTLRELNTVNTLLGGHAITLEAVKELAAGKKSLMICEIGCGGGDNLYAIYKKFASSSVAVRYIGIDINPECIAYAMQKYPQIPCEWICSDYAKVSWTKNSPDLIFSSLFCHHFTDEELLFMLNWLKKNARLGFFINDLHRHWLAFYLIKYITKFFSRSYLVKHDASLSVARSFRKPEWKRLSEKADIFQYSIRWRWAFRWLVTVKLGN